MILYDNATNTSGSPLAADQPCQVCYQIKAHNQEKV